MCYLKIITEIRLYKTIVESIGFYEAELWDVRAKINAESEL